MLGFLWSILNPLGYMVILTLVFSLLYKVSIPDFAAWVLIGILIWRFFSTATMQGLLSIAANPSLVGKVYVPRYLIVVSNNLASLLGASVEFLTLLPLLVVLGVNLSVCTLFLPAILVMEFLLIFGLSLSLSSLNLKYGDFGELWNMVLQLGFFLSPIVYDESLIPERFRSLYLLNPVTKLIDSARSILLFGQLPTTLDNGIMIAAIGVFLLAGFLIFRELEGRFAEEL